MKLVKKIIVAIDGYSSCGKSSFAKRIAGELDYIFIDTGAMYRSVSLFALQQNFIRNNSIDVNALKASFDTIKIAFRFNANHKLCTYLNGTNVENEIRGVTVSELVSEVSKIKEVRHFLVKQQQEMGKNKGIVMDGRDIGTVVFPQAEIKLFMTASTEVRVQRRYDELLQKGMSVSFEEIRKNIGERDYMDMNRSESPLKKADDAILLDNSTMTMDDQMKWFTELLKQKNLLVQ
jgi:cytidylate kinase